MRCSSKDSRESDARLEPVIIGILLVDVLIEGVHVRLFGSVVAGEDLLHLLFCMFEEFIKLLLVVTITVLGLGK